MAFRQINTSQQSYQGSFARRLTLCALALIAITMTGCMTRRLTINTNPPGARVYVSDEEIGITPCSHDFTYYGTRKIRIVKDGYETMVLNQPIPTPWYQIPPLDLITDNFVPGEIIDHRKITYELRPKYVEPRESLFQKAEGLRRSSIPLVPGPPITANPNQIPPNGSTGYFGLQPDPRSTLPPPGTTPQHIYQNP